MFRSKREQTQLDIPDDDLFIVESILDAKHGKVTKYVVKWSD